MPLDRPVQEFISEGYSGKKNISKKTQQASSLNRS